MKKIDYEHFGRFVYPINIKLHENKLYFNIVKTDFNENTYVSDLYVLNGKKPKRLTASDDVRSYYIVDGEFVFPSVRKSKDKESVKNGIPLTVLQKLSSGGREAEELLRLNYTALNFVFLSQTRFYFTAFYSRDYAKALDEAKGDAVKAREILKEDSDYAVFDEAPFWMNGLGVTNKLRSRLYFYDRGKITALTDEMTNVASLSLSIDREKLYFTAERYETVMNFKNRLCELDIASGKIEDISLDADINHTRILPLDGGALVVFAVMGEKYGINENDNIYMRRAGEKNFKKIYGDGMHCFYNSVNTDIKMERTLPEEVIFNGDKLYCIDTMDDSSHIVSIDTATGEVEQITKKRGMISELISDGGKGFYAIGMRLGGCEIYHINGGGEEIELTELNAAYIKKYDYSEPLDLKFTNENGDKIRGFALKPSNYVEGKKYPTVLDIHGGPKTAYGAVYFHEMQLWASKGYAVIFCNPTGSDGRGNKFADLRGRYGETDYRDIMKFVDVAVEKLGFINKNKIAVTGGSYGGFMTNWIIGHTDRFVAAASQRSISNFASFSNISDIGAYFGIDQTGASVWTDYEKVWNQSPLKYADKAKTPTLFIHSDGDYRCPLAEGLQMFYALTNFGVKTRLCMFKGENHELSRSGKPKHRVRRLKEITEWLSEYLDK